MENILITLTSQTFSLNIFVAEDLKYEKGEGWVALNDTHDTFIGDQLEWFINLDKNKKKEIKADLKKANYSPKGCIKELKSLIKQAIKLDILRVKE